jgi:hypothetical protein
MKLKAKGSQTQMRRGHMHTHTCTPPSVRPSVLPPFSRFVSGMSSLTRVRAYIHAGTCSMCAAIMSASHRCSVCSLYQLSDSTRRQRKSTVDILPTVLCVCCVRSLCTYARLRPSVPFLFTVASNFLHAHNVR